MSGPLSLVTRAELVYDQLRGGRPLSGDELESLCESHPELEPVLRQLQHLHHELGTELDGDEQPVLPGYEMLERLGMGGMGVVWAARHDALDRVVAVKFLSNAIASDDGARQRFLEEAKTVARIRHHHVVPIHDVIDTPDRTALVMELVPGADLHEVIQAWANSKVDPEGAIASVLGDRALDDAPPQRVSLLVWGNQIAQALSAAHAAGVLHRDVKPSNIRIRAGDRVAVLLDFGVARSIDQSVQTVGFAGTPRFAAPEQLRGGPIDERSDVFSLARTLEYAFARLEGLSDETPERRSGVRIGGLRCDLVGRLGKDIEAVLGRALEPDPRDRYPSAVPLARDLDRAVKGEIVEARPRGPLLRCAQGIVRNRLRSSLVVAGVAALASGAVLLREWPRIEAGRQVEIEADLSRRLQKGFQLLLDPRRRETAVTLFADLRRSAPESVDARLGHVASLSLLNRVDEARASIGLAPGENAEPPEVGWILDPGQVPADLNELGPFDDAARQASFATGLYLAALRSDREALFRRAAQAFADLRFLVEDATEQHFGAMAYAAARGGEVDLMESAIRGLQQLWPDSPTAWAWIALATERNDPERSLAAVAQVERRDSELFRYLRPLSIRSRLELEGPSAVEREISKALERAPGDVEFLILRARLDLGRGRADRARSTLQEVLQRDPDEAVAHELMAQILWDSEPHEVRPHLVRLTELRPAVAASWKNLGVHDLKHGGPERAVQAMERCVELDSADGPGRALFGEALFRSGDDRAEEHLVRAAEMLPTSARPHWFLSQVRLQHRDRDGSIRALEEALERLDGGGDGVRRTSVERALQRLRR